MAGDPIADLYDTAPAAPETLRPYQPVTPQTFWGGAFGRAAALSVAPTAGGVAAVPAGAAAGAALAAPIAAFTGPAAPVVEGAGVIGGALATAMGAGWAIDRAQTALIDALPSGATASLGIDQAGRARDLAEHPRAQFIGGQLPQLAFMRPGWGGVRALMIGAGVGGGVAAGTEYAETGTVDPFKVGVATVLGGSLGKNTRLGDRTMAPAHWAIERLPTGAGITQAATGARDTIRAGIAATGDRVAEAREATLARLFPLAPKPVRDRWLAAGTMDDVIGADQLAAAHGRDHLTPDEAAAEQVAWDAAITRGTSPFQPGADGDQEHGLRLSATMRAILAGDPLPAIGAPTSGPGTRASLLSGSSPFSGIEGAASKIIGAESGGDPNARNPFPGQTAAGLGQFTDPTWKAMYRRHFNAAGLSDAQILAERAKPDVSRRMTQLAVSDYAKVLSRAGLPVTDGNLYLTHFLGPRAVDVLHADPATPIGAIVPQSWIAVNPQLRGRSAGQVVAWTNTKMGGAGEVVPDRFSSSPAIEGADLQPDTVFSATDYIDDARAYARDTRGSLTPEAISKALGLDDAEQGAAVLGLLAGRDDTGLTMGRNGRLRRRPVSDGPEDALTFLARSGGISDAEGHNLIDGRNLDVSVRGVGKLVRADGQTIDAVGERLWEAGYFGPPETTARPDTDTVLQFIERAAGEKVYRPEDQAVAAERARAADIPPEDVELQQMADHVANLAADMGLDLGHADLADAARMIRDGAVPSDALSRVIDRHFDDANLAGAAETEGEHAAIDGYDPALSAGANEPWPDGYDWPPAGDGWEPDNLGRDEGDGRADGPQSDGAGELADAADGRSLIPFGDPVGEGARVQIESLEHDARMDVSAEDVSSDQPFRLSAEGDETTLADVLREIDAADRAAAELRGCLAPPAGGEA